MSKKRTRILVAAAVPVAAVVLLAVRAFQPPLPLTKLEAVTPGMSRSRVREVLGEPTRVFPNYGYEVQGTNYQTGEQWTYQRALTFGSINVRFDTNGAVHYVHYETF
jgi:hypothetical protein